jgi:hypothetical protein
MAAGWTAAVSDAVESVVVLAAATFAGVSAAGASLLLHPLMARPRARVETRAGRSMADLRKIDRMTLARFR